MNTPNENPIEIKVLPTGLLDVNCSMVSNRQTREIFLVDPGGDESGIYDYIDKSGFTLKAILHTHAHFDHIMGTAPLLEKYYQGQDIPVYLHEEDIYLWDHISEQAGRFGIEAAPQNQKITHFLKDNDRLTLCGMEITVLHTPGHSPGSCTFVLPMQEPALIVGDVIFQGSIGRTDLWRGDHALLLQSIREKILSQPGESVIIPGHGPGTTVSREAQTNPFLN